MQLLEPHHIRLRFRPIDHFQFTLVIADQLLLLLYLSNSTYSRHNVCKQSLQTGGAAVERRCTLTQTRSHLSDHNQHVRRYASEAPKSGGSNTLLYGGIGAAAIGGGYYYFSTQGVPKEAKDAANKVQNAVAPAASKGEAKKVFTGGDQGFISLVLDEVENINDNTKKFRFKFPESDQVSGLAVASALITKYKGPEMEKPVIRPYTPTSDEGQSCQFVTLVKRGGRDTDDQYADQAGFLDFVIKKYPNGPMSEHIHNMKPGQQLEMKGPIPKYKWETNKHDHIALLAGGTGITPMYQLCRAIFNNPSDNTKVSLVFGNVSEKDILLRKELEQLENEYPNRFRAFYVLDKPEESWKGGKGHITKDLLKTVIPGPKDGNVKVFVCGPPGLYKAISGMKKSPSDQGELAGYLKELGYTEEQVYKF
nr:nadh-cytochrome b5 reductase 2 [Quercus suber]